MVPLDVSNTRYDGGMNMKGFWYGVLMTIAIFIFIILPPTFLFYESEGLGMVSIFHLRNLEFGMQSNGKRS